jgi:nucleotide-binding universal stress UspA family protein
MILIAYDGSQDAKTAIRHSSELLPGAEVTVLTIWEPFATMLDRTPETLRPLAAVRRANEIDREEAEAAERCSSEGAELALTVGLNATARATALNGSVADTIIAQAGSQDVDAIVVGSRGLTAAARLLGSVSLAVIQRADRTVVVVPSANTN